MDFLQRTKRLLTPSQMEKLSTSSIIVFGCGGVGGYVVEMLVRSGVKRLSVVDFDKVDLSNLNRQIIATTKTIGMEKVKAVTLRAKEINPEIEIEAINKRFSSQTINDFDFTKFDYVVDAIDSVQDKVLLIKSAKSAGAKIISAMGAGNKLDLPSFKICDIYKTENDGLAKKMRKLLRSEGISSLDVCCSNQKGMPQNEIGSIAYQPAACGIMIASFVINEIIKEEKQ